MKHFTRHLPHYLSLFGVLAVGLAAFIWFSYDTAFQIAVAVAIAASYVVWGLVHHYLHRSLYMSVVIEYLAVAILGLTIVVSLLSAP